MVPSGGWLELSLLAEALALTGKILVARLN
jgi:hypothetical protein